MRSTYLLVSDYKGRPRSLDTDDGEDDGDDDKNNCDNDEN